MKNKTNKANKKIQEKKEQKANKVKLFFIKLYYKINYSRLFRFVRRLFVNKYRSTSWQTVQVIDLNKVEAYSINWADETIVLQLSSGWIKFQKEHFKKLLKYIW